LVNPGKDLIHPEVPTDFRKSLLHSRVLYRLSPSPPLFSANFFKLRLAKGLSTNHLTNVAIHFKGPRRNDENVIIEKACFLKRFKHLNIKILFRSKAYIKAYNLARMQQFLTK
jgi:hypothetical protein